MSQNSQQKFRLVSDYLVLFLEAVANFRKRSQNQQNLSWLVNTTTCAIKSRTKAPIQAGFPQKIDGELISLDLVVKAQFFLILSSVLQNSPELKISILSQNHKIMFQSPAKSPNPQLCVMTCPDFPRIFSAFDFRGLQRLRRPTIRSPRSRRRSPDRPRPGSSQDRIVN